jgi:hypothetical protein
LKISKVIFKNNLSKKLFRIILFLFIIKVISISIYSFLAQTVQVTTTPVTTTTTFYPNNFVCPVLDGCCFPNPLTNISFLQCISGTPYAFNCTLNGTYWVNATQTCEYPTTTTTTYPTTTTTKPTTSTWPLKFLQTRKHRDHWQSDFKKKKKLLLV